MAITASDYPACIFEDCRNRSRNKRPDLCYTHYKQDRRGEELRPVVHRQRTVAGADGSILCNSCGRFLPKDNFFKSKVSRFGVKAKCKSCHGEYQKRQRLLSTYGISFEEWEAMLGKYDHKCAICRTPENELAMGLVVDHNHETGEVRAPLCANCNAGIGMFYEREDLLARAIDYVRLHGIRSEVQA